MSLRYLDGFDHYDSGRLAEKWTGIVGGSIGTPGRFAGNYFHANEQGIYRTVGSHVQAIVGAAIRFPSGPPVRNPGGVGAIIGAPLLVMCSSAFAPFQQLSLNVGPGGQLLVVRCNSANNLTVLARSDPALVSFANDWQYFEFKSIADPANGGWAVRLNGLPIVSLPDSLAGQQTTHGGCAAWDTLSVYRGGNNVDGGATMGDCDVQADYDDLYWLDSLGAQNNNFLGDVRVEALFPVADGHYEDWTMNPAQGAGGHWKNVSENPPDDDVTYNSSATPGQIDTFTFQGLTGGVTTVKALQLVLDARKDDAALRQIAALQRQAGVDYPGITQNLDSAGYRFYLDPRDVNPATGLPYTVAEVNAIETGYKEIA